ncbi:MAG: hypothetical protein C0501_03790 [Isosphaera sp.]|nr:hypothetical protein [Isosphaera sp.]
MAKAPTTQQRLMRERARALATILLTNRDGVTVQDVEGDGGLLLMATLPPAEARGLRQLGVSLRYALAPSPTGRADHANKVLQAGWPVPRHGPFPFPLVQFFFTMHGEEAWYSWVAEPVVTAGGDALLPLRDRPDCHPLTAKSAGELLDRVDAWYDAHYRRLAAVPTGVS